MFQAKNAQTAEKVFKQLMGSPPDKSQGIFNFLKKPSDASKTATVTESPVSMAPSVATSAVNGYDHDTPGSTTGQSLTSTPRTVIVNGCGKDELNNGVLHKGDDASMVMNPEKILTNAKRKPRKRKLEGELVATVKSADDVNVSDSSRTCSSNKDVGKDSDISNHASNAEMMSYEDYVKMTSHDQGMSHDCSMLLC